MTAAASAGFLTGLSLIVAFGPQNAFLLRQGMTGAHVWQLCLFCTLSDALLIFAGVAGFGALAGVLPGLPLVLTLGGAAFLACYGLLRLRAAWRGDYAGGAVAASGSLGAVLATAAALTWLNPHVYLDTMVLIGALATAFESPVHRAAFGTGAALASALFFFGTGYGARLLAPVMTSPRAWALLDSVIGVTMLALAAGLLLTL